MNGDFGLRFYLLMTSDFPGSLLFIAHQLILLQYYELAIILEILLNMDKHWFEASNKFVSVRLCLNTTMLMVFGFEIGHFIVKAYYTFFSVEDKLATWSGVFGMMMKLILYFLAGYSASKLYRTLKNEHFLAFKRIWYLHVILLFCQVVIQTLYETFFLIFVVTPTND